MGTTADKLEYLQGTKAAIKQAIVNKGVAVPDGTTFRAYAEKIADISGGDSVTVTFSAWNEYAYVVYTDPDGNGQLIESPSAGSSFQALKGSGCAACVQTPGSELHRPPGFIGVEFTNIVYMETAIEGAAEVAYAALSQDAQITFGVM